MCISSCTAVKGCPAAGEREGAHPLRVADGLGRGADGRGRGGEGGGLQRRIAKVYGEVGRRLGVEALDEGGAEGRQRRGVRLRFDAVRVGEKVGGRPAERVSGERHGQ